MTVPTIRLVTEWHCRFCRQTDVTFEPKPHARLHTCPGKGGISMPFIQVGSRAKVEVREREDYIGKEVVTTDANGRPIMSVVTTREDGSNDAIVFAPAARATVEDHR